MKLTFAVLAVVAAGLPAVASEAHFGLVGITALETARLNAFCDGSVTPTPCDVTFEFHDVNGRLLKQVSMILQPETTGFADFAVPAAVTAAGRSEIEPCLRVLRGTAQPSLEVFDNFFHRTRLLINWGDGANPRSAADVDFGVLGITRFDIARMGASCMGGDTACDVAFEFHDANDRTLKSARLTLAPGTSAFLDLRLSETGLTESRGLIKPCFTVGTGAAVLDLQTIDVLTGLTVTHAYAVGLVGSDAP